MRLILQVAANTLKEQPSPLRNESRESKGVTSQSQAGMWRLDPPGRSERSRPSLPSSGRDPKKENESVPHESGKSWQAPDPAAGASQGSPRAFGKLEETRLPPRKVGDRCAGGTRRGTSGAACLDLSIAFLTTRRLVEMQTQPA